MVVSGTKDPVGKAEFNKRGPKQNTKAGGNTDSRFEVGGGTEINTPRPSYSLGKTLLIGRGFRA